MDSSLEIKDKKTDIISAKDKKLLFHLTPIKNVESILKNGLKPRSCLNEENFEDTANPDIINKREEMGLTKYIPFHFIPNGPYDGSVRKSNPDEDFAYICVSRSTVKDNCKIIVGHPLNNSTENNSTENNSTENNSTENNSTENNSTENNSTENNSTENNSTENNSTENNSGKLYNWDKGFEKIDWALIDKRDYTDEACKQMCMSEALYLGTITHENIQCIWVPSAQVGQFEKMKKELNGKFHIDEKDFLTAENKKNE
ncbi:TPA: DUF4433 domain-containing protein [Campylobacter lari]|nr:DUF4433 domain-containing protein [Campylobacter lari]